MIYFSHSILAVCYFFFIFLSHPSPPPQSTYLPIICHSAIFPHTLSYSSPSFFFSHLFPLPPQSPHMPIIPPNMILAGSLLYRHWLFLPNPHLSIPFPPLPTHHLPSIFINFPIRISFDLLSPFAVILPLIFPPHSSIILSCFDIFSYSNLVTVFTHQTIFILLLLCHVIFLIFSCCCFSSQFSSTFLTLSTLAPWLSHSYCMVYVHSERQCNTMIIFNKLCHCSLKEIWACNIQNASLNYTVNKYHTGS